MPESPHKPKSEALDAEIMPSISNLPVADNYRSFVSLAPNQKNVLAAMIDDFMSGNIRKDTEIAQDLGISVKTVYNCKTHSGVTSALTQLMPEIVKAKLPKYLAKIEEHGEKDYKALELLLKYAGLYVPSSRNVNVNANISAQSEPTNQVEVLERHLMRYMSVGYDLQRYITEVSEVWQRLQADGVT